MARRTVTATFSGGMISDEMAPNSARYIENYLVQNGGGLVPVGPVADMSIPYYGMAGSSGAKSGMNQHSTMYGWVAASPLRIDTYGGFCGLVEYATATATNYAVSSVTAGQTSATRFALMRAYMLSPQSSSQQQGFWNNCSAEFVQSGDFRPFGGSITPTSTAASSISGAWNNAYNTMKSIEFGPEVLFHDQTWGISRYAGGYWQGDTGFNYSGDTVTSQSAEITAMCQVTSATGTYTASSYSDAIKIFGLGSGTMIRNGSFVCIAAGPGLDSQLTSTTSTATDPVQTRAFKIIGQYSDNGSDYVVKVDRKMMCGTTTSMFKCVLTPVATLDINQISRTVESQPWARAKVGAYTGFSSYIKPKPKHICEHGGRLFAAGFQDTDAEYSNSKIRWSATVDETLQLTGTSVCATSTASTAALTAATANFGIEYNGMTLWDSNGYIECFKSIGGASVGLASFGSELLIMRQGAMFRMVGGVSYSGDTDSLDIQIISDTIGPDSEHSWAKTPEGIIFTCNGNIYLYDGNQISDISQGTISKAYRDNLLTEMNRNGFRYETKVTNSGNTVMFSHYRPSVSTGIPYSHIGYGAITQDQLSGSSIHNKHLVLDLASKTWTIISNKNINVPVRMLEVGDASRGGLGKILFNKWRPLSYGATSTAVPSWYKTSLSIADVSEVFHASGVRSGLTSATMDAWTRRFVAPEVGSIITHPVLGYGKLDPIRPRAVSVKRTAAATSTGYLNRFTSTPTSITDYSTIASKLFVHNADAGYVPLTDQSGPTVPLHWSQPRSGEASGTPPTTYTDGSRSASMDSSAWQLRTSWDITSGTNEGAAASQVDKLMLNNIESVMHSPTVHYRDAFWSELQGTDISYKSHIIHGIQVEYDDLENGADR